MFEKLRGLKTHAITFCALMGLLGAYLDGKMTLDQAIPAAAGLLYVSAGRSALATESNKLGDKFADALKQLASGVSNGAGKVPVLLLCCFLAGGCGCADVHTEVTKLRTVFAGYVDMTEPKKSLSDEDKARVPEIRKELEHSLDQLDFLTSK